MTQLAPPPGWYSDPARPGNHRWWDGQAWGPEAQIRSEPAASAPTIAAHNSSRGLAIAAMIAGILSLLLCWVFVLGLVLGLAAVGLGIAGLRTNRGMAITGIITGCASVAIFLAVVIAGAVTM